MLKSLLFALAMGNGPDLEARAAELERLQGRLVSHEVVTAQRRAFGILVELNRINRIGAKLGPLLVGDSEDSFEEGLARLHDDDKFAELLGRIVRFTAIAFDHPALVKRLDAEVGPQDTPSPIAARFAADLELLGDESRLPTAASEFGDVFSEMREAAPTEIGRTILDAMYDPAATKATSDIAWAVVRVIARAIAVRHLDSSGALASAEWSTGLFKDSKPDVECLAKLLSTFFEPQGQIAYMIESYKLRAKRDAIDEVMSQLSTRPEAWAEHFGIPPED